MDRKISVIIPFVRPEGVVKCIQAVKKNTGLLRTQFEIIADEDKERIGVAKMVDKLTSRSKHDLVCFLADDTIPQPGFLVHALKAMESLPDSWGLVGLNDRPNSRLPCHWLADKRLLPALGGYFFHPEYHHCYVDHELMERCKALDRYTYCKKSILWHFHPLINGGKNDKFYEEVYSTEWMKHDLELLQTRRLNNWPEYKED